MRNSSVNLWSADGAGTSRTSSMTASNATRRLRTKAGKRHDAKKRWSRSMRRNMRPSADVPHVGERLPVREVVDGERREQDEHEGESPRRAVIILLVLRLVADDLDHFLFGGHGNLL